MKKIVRIIGRKGYRKVVLAEYRGSLDGISSNLKIEVSEPSLGASEQ